MQDVKLDIESNSEQEKIWKDPVFWSGSYCILSCGGTPLSILKQYFEGQAGAEELEI